MGVLADHVIGKAVVGNLVDLRLLRGLDARRCKSEVHLHLRQLRLFLHHGLGLFHHGLRLFLHHGLRFLHHRFWLRLYHGRGLLDGDVLARLAQRNLHTHQQVLLPVEVVVLALLRVPLVGQHISVVLQSECHALRQCVLYAAAQSSCGQHLSAVPQVFELAVLQCGNARTLVHGCQTVSVVVLEGYVQSHAGEAIDVPLAVSVPSPDEVGQRQRSVEICLHVFPLILCLGVRLPVASLPARRPEAQTEGRRKLTSHAQRGSR